MKTWSALVGDTCPNLFALGAATGTAAVRSRSSAIGELGIRTPTKPVYAVIISGIKSRLAFTTKVRGPGQYLPARAEKSRTISDSD